jgi:hypothetical protein
MTFKRTIIEPLAKDLFRRVLDLSRSLLELGQYDRARLGAPEANPWAASVFTPDVKEEEAINHFFVEKDGQVSIPPPALVPYSDPQTFSAKKPAGTYRILLLGSSAAKAWCCNPYFTLAKCLKAQIEDAHPGRKIEVIDCALARRNSFDIAAIAEQSKAVEPDLLIVYEGNNEMMSYSLVHGKYERTNPSLYYRSLVRVLTGRDPGARASIREIVERACADNAERIIRATREAGAKLIFVAPPANLEFEPSMQLASDLGPKEIASWIDEMRRAEEMEARDPKAALPMFERLAQRGDSAGLQYRIASCLKKSAGDAAEIKKHLERALELDQSYSTRSSPRATNELIDALAGVCSERGVPLIDGSRLFAHQAPHGIPGYGLFIDYCHPSIDGHRLLSTAIATKIVEERLIATSARSVRKEVISDEALTLTPKLHASVWLNAALQSMLYVPTRVGTIEDLLRRALERAPEIAELLREIQRFVLRRCSDTAYQQVVSTWQRVLGPTFFWRGYLSLNVRKDWGAVLEALERVAPLDPEERRGLLDAFADYFFLYQRGTIYAATEPFLLGPGLSSTLSEGPSSSLLLPYSGDDACAMSVRLRSLWPEQSVAFSIDGREIMRAIVPTEWTDLELVIPGEMLGRGLHRIELAYRVAVAAPAVGRYEPEETDSGGARVVLGYHPLMPNLLHRAVEIHRIAFQREKASADLPAFQPPGMDVAIIPAVLDRRGDPRERRR